LSSAARDEKVEAYVDRLTAGKGFDVVFDTIGGNNLPTSFAAAAESGRVATTNARTTQDLATLHARALSLHVIFMLLPMLRGRAFTKARFRRLGLLSMEKLAGA
jgi:NADPH2:quinone reductase